MADVSLARMWLGGTWSWVALKRMRPTLAADPHHRQQFDREGQLGALLTHRNVVSVTCQGSDADGPFLALEYVDGPTVAQLLKGEPGQSSVLPLSVALAIVADIAEGLDYAHNFQERPDREPGVIHRDISPDNVLVDFSGVARVADFGLARAVEATQITADGMLQGKLRFLASELFDGVAHSASTDLYALAGMMFEIFTGVPPFSAPTDAELMKRIWSVVPPRVDMLRSEVPQPIADWIEAALQKRALDRPQNLSGLNAELRVLAGSRERRQAAIAGHLAPWLRTREPLPPAARAGSTGQPIRARAGRWLAWASGLAALGAVGLALWPAPRAVDPIALVEPPRPAAARAMAPDPAPVKTEPSPEPPEPLPPEDPEPHVAKVSRRSNEPGSLWIRVRPWAEVLIDGKKVGQTPLVPIRVPAGKHTVVLINESLNVRRSYPVTVSPAKTTELKITLGQGHGAPSAR